MARKGQQPKRLDVEKLRGMPPDERKSFLNSLGLELNGKTEPVASAPPAEAEISTPAAPLSPPEVQVQDRSPEIPASIPKNSKWFIFANFLWENFPALQKDYTDLSSYARETLVAFNSSDHPDHIEAVQGMGEYGITNLNEALQELDPAQVTKLMDEWVELADNDENLKRKYIKYKKSLIEQGLAEIEKRAKPTREKTFRQEAELKLIGQPEFKYEKGEIKGSFKLENDPHGKDRGRNIYANVPFLARIDLESQKLKLQKALAEMMVLNNYKSNPTVSFDQAGKNLNFGYGKEVGLVIGVDRVEQALNQTRRLPGGFKEATLEQYRKAKEFRQEHGHLDFNTAGQSIKKQSIQADNVIKVFEGYLLKLPATGPGDKRRAADLARDFVFNKLWEKEAGAEVVNALRQKAEAAKAASKPSRAEAAPAQSVASKPEAKPAGTSTTAATGPESSATKDRWTDKLDLNNPEFKRVAENFWQAVERDFGGNWEKFLAHHIGSGNKRKKDAIVQYAINFNITIPHAIRLAGIRILQGDQYKGQQEEFEKLLAMPRAQIKEVLPKHLLPDSFLKNSTTKGDWLRSYLIDELRRRAVKPGEREEREQGAAESGNGNNEGQGQPAGEEVDTEENVTWETIQSLLEKHGELTAELLEEETGLEGEELDNLLTEYLQEIGYWEAYESVLEEYEVENSTKYLVNAVNEYTKLYKKKQAAGKKVVELEPEESEPSDEPEGDEEEGETSEAEEHGQESTEEVTELDGVEIPENFTMIKDIPGTEGVLLKDKLTGFYFIGLIKEDKVEAVALPEDLDVKKDKDLAVAVKALESLSAEFQGNIRPNMKVSGTSVLKNDIYLELQLSGGNLKISAKDFADPSLLAPEVRDKDEHNSLFKVMLLARMAKYNAKPVGELTPEDKKQIELTVKEISRLLTAPQEKNLSFAQQAVRSALKEKMDAVAKTSAKKK